MKNLCCARERNDWMLCVKCCPLVHKIMSPTNEHLFCMNRLS